MHSKCEIKIGVALNRAQVGLVNLTLTMTYLTLSKQISQAKAKRELDTLVTTNKSEKATTSKKVPYPTTKP